MIRGTCLGAVAAALALTAPVVAQVAVFGKTIHTAVGTPLRDAVVIVENGKISWVGPQSEAEIPSGFRTLRAEVVTPGLVDGRSTIGLSGYLNQPHDQDQIELSQAIQPELRAIDAYNPAETLVAWARSYGVTTIHTGHAPRSLISGQTAVFKTRGRTVDEALVQPVATVAATIGEGARRSGKDSPGTRAKMASMLRAELARAQDYLGKRAAETGDRPDRDLRLEALARVLQGDVPLMVTAHKAHDILTALRIRLEFGIPMILDGAAEGYEVIDQIRAAAVPVLLHPTMLRAAGEAENVSFETAGLLERAGLDLALQSGFEAYVPKSRLVLFEAAVAAAHGMGFDAALRSITIGPARILGIQDRVGSIEVGKDGDLALYDGDPFEYVTHCVGVVIEGEVVSEVTR